MAKQAPKQKSTVGRVMHEWKHGELESGRSGRRVKNRRQAVAIALSEAGASKYQSKGENKRRLAKTKVKEGRGETAEAQKEGKAAQRRTMAAAGSKSGRRRKAAATRSRTRGKVASGTEHRNTGRVAKRASGNVRARGNGSSKTKAELMRQAKRQHIAGRSRMSKAELSRALHA